MSAICAGPAVGYLVAGAGPLELGLLHSATGSWDLPVAMLFVLNGGLFVNGTDEPQAVLGLSQSSSS
jgi:cyanate permease